MRRVAQEDETGCGISCVAIVSGQTYRQAKNYFKESVFIKTNKRLYTRHFQLRHALDKLGIPTEKKRFRYWRSIQTDAIVPVNKRQDGGWHWVVFVFDVTRPYILDPSQNKLRPRYDFRGIKARGYYIAIKKV